MPNSPTTVSEVVANVVSGLAFQGLAPELLDLSERLTQLHALNQALDQVVAVNTRAVQSAGSGGVVVTQFLPLESQVVTGARLAKVK